MCESLPVEEDLKKKIEWSLVLSFHNFVKNLPVVDTHSMVIFF